MMRVVDAAAGLGVGDVVHRVGQEVAVDDADALADRRLRSGRPAGSRASRKQTQTRLVATRSLAWRRPSTRAAIAVGAEDEQQPAIRPHWMWLSSPAPTPMTTAQDERAAGDGPRGPARQPAPRQRAGGRRGGGAVWSRCAHALAPEYSLRRAMISGPRR